MKLISARLFARILQPLAVLLVLSAMTAAQSAPMAMPSAAPSAASAPRALIVVAHPDDESCFAATVYEITHNLGGTVDQMVITNGEGGFRYSLLAESYYGLPLTDEATGRAALPEIRKRELFEAGRILGISNHYFLDERDLRYTQDVDEVLEQHWHPGVALDAVSRRMAEGHYDFVFTLFPSPETHGGHKAATLTALEAVAKMSGAKPVVLGCQGARIADAAAPAWKPFESAKHHVTVGTDVFRTDRTVKFGFRNALSYQIIVGWMVAAHKSQGAFQAEVGHSELEEFAVLDSATPQAAERARALFERLAATAASPVTRPSATQSQK